MHNNLVASNVVALINLLGPPKGLLAEIQGPQGMLFLPREEGGHGLMHLASRTAIFRIQFTQTLLTGPADLMWRDIASCILRRVSNFEPE